MNEGEKKREYTGTIQHVKACVKFWKAFNCILPEGTLEWAEAKIAEKDATLTYEDNERMRRACICAHAHGALPWADEAFKSANQNAERLQFDIAFDESVEKEMSNEDKEKD
jgi:hypothetical protein